MGYRCGRLQSQFPKYCIFKYEHARLEKKIYRSKRALTLKQYRLLLYHRAIKQYITYEQNRFICAGPLVLEQCDIP